VLVLYLLRSRRRSGVLWLACLWVRVFVSRSVSEHISSTTSLLCTLHDDLVLWRCCVRYAIFPLYRFDKKWYITKSRRQAGQSMPPPENARTYAPDMELGHWVTGSMGHLGHHFDSVWYPSFSAFRKKAQDKDIKIYIFVKIRPAVIEILTFSIWSSKFYFPEACKRQTAIKTGKPLAHCKRLSAT